ncbi:hypothetical protein [uncultured Aquimarina sp.]|uniref:hypothetical protein n=1 Tax=uncultured Aquimarina sp. TaxID=575652 RepID=UPI00263623B7|nr:hypothetical protein [uncultured Aquimarina sp.]
MKKIFINLILIMFLCNCTEQTKSISELKNSVDQSWIKENPSIRQTKRSFFNKTNHSEFLILDLNFSGQSIPFVWDCDFSILNFLTNKEYLIENENHQFNNKNYTTSTIKWTEEISSLLWFREKIHKSKVADWNLENYFDCAGNISFPNLNFEKIFELENARTNLERGLAIIPFTSEIKNIVRNEIELTSETGKLIKGIGYDINDDNITDIFIHYQELDDEGFTGYKRLYVNIDGNWTCKWIEYYEECI